MTDRSIPTLLRAQVDALVLQGNEIVDNLRAHGLIQHLEQTDPVTTADATDLATGVTLGNALKAAFNAHCASTAAHDAADATNTVSSANATDQTSLNTLLNEIKTDLNAHIVLSAAHGGRIAGEGRVTIATVSTANASDLATSVALVNALKAAMNRHFASGARRITYIAP